jgi:hypothetical protein
VPNYTAFQGHERLASGDLTTVALAIKNVSQNGGHGPVLAFDDNTGALVDLDLRGTEHDILALIKEPESESQCSELRGRGRPKLGVVAREITLLPRHWDWLNSQPGGASVALRKLVDQARHANHDKDQTRARHEAAYRFISAIAGNLPDFDEATRALFADDAARFVEQSGSWPADVRHYARQLAFPGANRN